MGKKEDKELKELDDINVDELDLDNLDSLLGDDIIDDDDDIGEDAPKSRKPITDFTVSALKSFTPSVDNIKRVSDSITEEFGGLQTNIDTTLRTMSDIERYKEEFKTSITPTVNRLKSVSRRLLPYTEKLMPKKLYEKVEGALESTPENEVTKVSLEEERNKLVSDKLANLFKGQIELSKEKDKQDKFDKIVKNKIEESRHSELYTTISKIKNIIKSNYTFLQIGMKNFMMKNLELKYKHIFIAQDTLNLTKKLVEINDNKLEAIKYNTALPDIQKQEISETFKDVMRQRTLGTLSSTFGDWTSNFGKKIMENVKENIFEAGATKINELGEFLSEIGEGILEMREMDEEEGGTASGTAGELAGGFGRGFLFTKIGKLFRKISGQQGEDFDKSMKNFNKTFALRLRDKVSELSGREDIVGKVFTFLNDRIIPEFEEERGSVENTLAGRALEAVPFDVLTRRSIVEIIPGYLSKILQQTTIMATGDQTTEELVFDPETETYVTVSEYKKSKYKKLFGTEKERTKDAAKIIEKLLGGYTYHGGKKDDFSKHLDDVTKFVNNMAKHGQLIKPEIILDYLQGKSLNDKQEKYMELLFKDVDDQEALAEILVKSFFKDVKDEELNKDVIDKINSLSIDLGVKRDEFLKQLGDFNIFGGKRFFSEFVGKRSESDVEEYRNKIESKYEKIYKDKYKKDPEENREDFEEKYQSKIDSEVKAYAERQGISHEFVREQFAKVDSDLLGDLIGEGSGKYERKLEKLQKERDKFLDRENISKRLGALGKYDKVVDLVQRGLGKIDNPLSISLKLEIMDLLGKDRSAKEIVTDIIYRKDKDLGIY